MVAALLVKITFAECITGTWFDCFDADFFAPSKSRDLLKPLLSDCIDYDMLWEGLEGPDE